MRPFSALPAGFTAAIISLVLSAEASLADQDHCLSRSTDFGATVACGHHGSLNYCLSVAPLNIDTAYIRRCFVNAGCTAEEAVLETDWAMRMCNDQSGLELRRRLLHEDAGRPNFVYTRSTVKKVTHAIPRYR
jgi:hypothetical protein